MESPKEFKFESRKWKRVDILQMKKGLVGLTKHLRYWEQETWKALIPLYRNAVEEGAVNSGTELAICNDISDVMLAMPALERALLSLRSVREQMEDEARERKEGGEGEGGKS